MQNLSHFGSKSKHDGSNFKITITTFDFLKKTTQMKRIITLTLILIGLTSTYTHAERYYYFDHLKSTDGLPSNTIYCAMQDQSGFMWIGTRDGLCRYDGQSFLRISEISPVHKMNCTALDVTEDISGKIWFCSQNGVGYYDPFTDDAGIMNLPENNRPVKIEADSKGNVWVAARDLFRYDTLRSGRHTYTFGEAKPTMITEDSLGNIWVLTDDGAVYTYDRLKNIFNRQQLDEKIRTIESTQESSLLAGTEDGRVLLINCINMNGLEIFSSDGRREIRCLKEGEYGEFWIGTDKGLFIRRHNHDYNGEAYHDEATPASISADFITSIDKDRDGNIWIGTYYTGLNIWKNKADEMAIYFPNPSENSIKGKIVRSICPDEGGNIWFCTEDGWLNCLEPKEHKVSNYEIIKDLNMHDIVMDGDRMWICSYGNGLFLFDLTGKKVVRHYDLPDKFITTGIKTSSETILIGTRIGLYRHKKETDSFELIPETDGDYIHTLYQDSRDILWIGTYGNGLYCTNKDGKILARHTLDNGLTSKYITSFFEDSRHRMWVTTEGGGVCVTPDEYHIDNLSFDVITREDGLASDITCAAVEDNDGTIWVSTTNGITTISGSDLKITGQFNGGNEVTGYQYSYGAVCYGQNGILYFGNTDGMISLVPSKVNNNESNLPLYITSIEARSASTVKVLKNQGKSVMTSTDLEVKHKDASTIYISFVTPEFTTQNPIYGYRLRKGKKEMLRGITGDNSVSLTGLRAGRYDFSVATVGNPSPEDSRTINLTILPHPMLSRTACVIYLLICLAALSALFYLLELRRKGERARQYAKLVNNKEKEIYNAKINFFTNITHEIRTPLTLIKMPLDKIIASKRYTPESEKDLRTMQANTDRLLSLTNQILDMRKMERNEMKLSFINEDLCAIVHKAIRLFEHMAQEQHITMNISIPENPVMIMCAKDSVLTIISNLLSNAVKYGKDRINIIVGHADEGMTATVRVESNGEIIPDFEKEKIFQIFFQREGAAKEGQGTGLGLPYARNLANMHNGKLYLDSNVQEMNSFVLELPVKQAEEVNIEAPEPAHKPVERENVEYDNSRHTVLIVEDSAEMREYLADDLSEEYNIRTATNGAEALDMIKTEKIDLVISDIMMPIMDGCELCNAIKSDSDLSHIPVILLTAVVGTETRIETLEVGADGYIEKPFPIELLRSNISNLFMNKEISYRQFMNKPLTHYSSVTANKVDQEYMDKVHDFIMKHIAETDLNIENLTSQLGTSKSSLYRKLKANTGLSINEYIRICRLKQAAELLSSQKYKINEVAFMTGFSSPSYFATCFQKQFNITPSEFVKNLGQ